MWGLSPCTSTRLSSTDTVRKAGIRRLPRVSFPTLVRMQGNKTDPRHTKQNFILQLAYISNAISSHTVWMCSKPELRLHRSSAQRILLSVRLLRKCTIMILNHIYCPRLAPYLVGKNTFTKECICGTCPLDHIKAQMVKADFIKWVTYVQKNCTCSTASMRNLRYKLLSEWTVGTSSFSFSSADR